MPILLSWTRGSWCSSRLRGGWDFSAGLRFLAFPRRVYVSGCDLECFEVRIGIYEDISGGRLPNPSSSSWARRRFIGTPGECCGWWLERVVWVVEWCKLLRVTGFLRTNNKYKVEREGRCMVVWVGFCGAIIAKMFCLMGLVWMKVVLKCFLASVILYSYSIPCVLSEIQRCKQMICACVRIVRVRQV